MTNDLYPAKPMMHTSSLMRVCYAPKAWLRTMTVSMLTVKTDQTRQMCRLIAVFAGRKAQMVGFVMQLLISHLSRIATKPA